MKNLTDGFFTTLKVERGYSAGTIEAYRLDLERGLLPFLYGRDVRELKDVTSDDIRSYLDYLANTRGNSSAARARKLAAIKSFFNYLVEAGELPVNPAAAIKSPKITEREPNYLSDEECRKLLYTVSKTAMGRFKSRDFAIIVLLLHAGIRVSELTSLKMEDVSLENGRIKIMRKGGKEQYVFLNQETINVMTSYVASRKSGAEKFFYGPKGRDIGRTSIYRLVGKYLALSSIRKNKRGPHLLRHTFCTRLHQKGVDPLVIRDMAGHKSITTTMRYIKIENIEQIAAVKKLEFGIA